MSEQVDRDAVLATLTSFLSGVHTGDEAAMLGLVLPEGGATLVRDGVPLHMSLREVVSRVVSLSSPSLREYNEDPVVMIGGDLAAVWSPFKVASDDRVRATGIAIYSLLRHDGIWVITGLTDFNRPERDDAAEVRGEDI